jgi:hypothetical protein
MSAMNTGRYISSKMSDKPYEGERFADDGFPIKCEDAPVFELMHSNGRSVRFCEYHIQYHWNAWPPFRNAVRDIWPVEKTSSQLR